jgi:hypothetical protein
MACRHYYDILFGHSHCQLSVVILMDIMRMYDEVLTRDVLSVSLIIGSFFLKSQTTQRGANVEARICCTEIQKINPLNSANNNRQRKCHYV